MTAIPPIGPDWQSWARALMAYLNAVRSKLAHKTADARAVDNGTLLWDEALQKAVVSIAGVWQPLATASGGVAWGTITGTLSSQADLVAALAGKSNTGHTHAQADVTGLVAALAAKSDVGHAHATFTAVADGFAPLSGGGTTNFLRADGTWASPGGGGLGGSVTLDFGAAPGGTYVAETVVDGGITAGSRVNVWVQGTTADHNAVEHALIAGNLGLSVVPGTGDFTIHAASDLRLTGDVSLRWEAA